MLFWLPMPLYDYACRECGHRFEALVRDATPVTCPACAAAGPERQLSMFAVASEATRQSSLGKARRANRKVSRDKAMADVEYVKNRQH